MKAVLVFAGFMVLFSFLLVLNVSPVFALGEEKINPSVLERFETEDIVKVDVYLVEGLSNREFDSVVSSVGGEVVKEYYPEGFIAEMTKDEVFSLASNEDVLYILENLKIKLHLQDAVEIIDAVDAWDAKVDNDRMTGRGQTVCVIDTGVDFTHPDLADKNILGGNLDCTIDSDCPLDPDGTDSLGHGTHVAGIVAAQGGINGIAKGVNIISLDVMDEDRTVEVLHIKRAIEGCVNVNNAEEYDVDVSVISISLGTEQLFSDSCDFAQGPLSRAINSAVVNGISVVASTGNEGDREGIALPSCMENAIPVAATTKAGDVLELSNYNWMVKLFAPGDDINSTAPFEEEYGYYATSSGTSMSTPMVSGAIAIMNQYLDRAGREMHPKTEIEDALFRTGNEIRNLPEQWTQINVMNALVGIDEEAPVVKLVSPTNGYVYSSGGEGNRFARSAPIFTCGARDLSLNEMTLRVERITGDEMFSESIEVLGSVAQESFFVPYSEWSPGLYEWNCEVSDEAGNVGEFVYDKLFIISSGNGAFGI